MIRHIKISILGFVAFAAAFIGRAQAQPSWQQEFAKMPLVESVTNIDRFNFARVMLNSFKKNDAVKALIFMPGATDEFYFFHRAHADITNANPTLLDAVAALTNHTYLHATVVAPFLVIHTTEDPLEPIIIVKDQHTADRIRHKHFEKRALFNDTDWDGVRRTLAIDLNTRAAPPEGSHASYHFFRHSLAAYDLEGWDAIRALEMAGKTQCIIKKNLLEFVGDDRFLGAPVPPDSFMLKDAGLVK